MSLFQILAQISNRSESAVIYKDVYNICQSVMRTEFKKHKHSRTSSLLYTNVIGTLHELYLQNKHYVFAFCTSIIAKILSTLNIQNKQQEARTVCRDRKLHGCWIPTILSSFRSWIWEWFEGKRRIAIIISLNIYTNIPITEPIICI